MIKLEAPFTEDKIRALKVGDMVSISGTLYTGRDAFHKYLHDGGAAPVDLTDQIIYHCGPVIVREGDQWVVKAAGPTTSIREEPYQGDILRKFGVRGVIGKGGMGEKTLQALQEVGAVYMHAVGGAAQVLARCVTRVKNVYMLEELGSPEAVWELEVRDFPVVITMDSHGGSLHREVLDRSSAALDAIL
jgi:tartrate/fumarate subfamily iron-sulfur-dependent hydro-lyase beta chain